MLSWSIGERDNSIGGPNALAYGEHGTCGSWSARNRRTRRSALCVHARHVLAVALITMMASTIGAFGAGDRAHGEELYLRYCQGCHGPDGRGGGKAFMPHVGPLAKKGYVDLLEDESLALVIKEGGAAVGKSGYMPSWKETLPNDAIADVIAYIRTFVEQ